MNAELYQQVLKAVGNMDGSRSTHFLAEQKLIALAPRCREELEKQDSALYPDIPRYCTICGQDLGHGTGPLCFSCELKAREPEKQQEECVWVFTDGMTHYETDCDESGENHMQEGMKYCPYCRLPIRVEEGE
jgi:hypothetical protein